MKGKEVKKRSEALFIVGNLILSIVAFSFLLGLSMPLVSAGKDDFNMLTDNIVDWYNEHGASSSQEISQQVETGKQGFWAKFLELIGAEEGNWKWNAIKSVQWAAGAYFLGQMAGGMLGLSEEGTKALSIAASAGFGTWRLFSGLDKTEGLYNAFDWSGWGPAAHPGVWGLVIGAVLFIALYKSESKEIITFECYPWEAPTGGANCEKCNSDLYPCSEYRCKSLGQACQLLNAGTGEEACTRINRNDAKAPVITPWEEPLTKDYKYKPDTAINPPDRGVKIQYLGASDGCVKAFTPLSFGIETDEPAQCMIDYNRTDKFEDMQFFFEDN